jgi:hypothetical protein
VLPIWQSGQKDATAERGEADKRCRMTKTEVLREAREKKKMAQVI